MDLNYHRGSIPKDIGALFVTPSVRGEHFFRRFSHAVG